MRESTVFSGTGNIHRADLQQAIVAAKKLPVKVYRTYTYAGATSYVYTTTSKDVHLALGALGQDVQSLMALFLTEEFKRNDVLDELLLDFRQKSEERGEFLLVTRSENKSGWVNFTLSPVH